MQQLHTAAPRCCAARSSISRGQDASLCRKVGLGVLEMSIAACTGADVMAGGAGAAGAAPDVRHQPQGYPELYLDNLDILSYPGIYQKPEGYPGTTRCGVYPGITPNNTA